MVETVDVVVVGLGPGGEEAAGRLAEAGLEVVGVEAELVGGECPYWGCIPSKMMIRAGNALAEARRVGGLAGHAEVRPDFAQVAARIRTEATDDWDDRVAVERLEGKGGRFVRGRGRLDGPGRVLVGERVFEARRGVVLATGTVPVAPTVDGLAGTPFWTNREAIKAESAPESLVVLGAGAIGLELAQAFARFGTRVTVVEAAERALALEEPESSELAVTVLEADGVRVLTGVAAARVDHGPDGFTLHLDDGSVHRGQRLLVAAGRRADLVRLGLETVGLDPQARVIDVDEHLRAADRLWAVGDITGKGAFTHVATYQAGVAVADVLGAGGPGADYRALPRVTFLDPEIGAVGLTEAQARDGGVDVATGAADIPASTRGWIHKAGNEGFIKLVADRRSGLLVGATSAGPAGGEVMAALAVAIHGRVPVSELRRMIYAYPTFHRAVDQALRDLDL